ncbi:MAG: VanZ family protein [Eubacterium sp.]|nr:VanZ family protein [Eubacterium sp.]
MKQEKSKKNKTAAIVFWILTAVAMGLVFFFSSRNADESSLQSGWLLDILNKIFRNEVLSDFVIRKTAHFTEFAGLCFLFNFSFYYTYGKPKRILSLVLTSAYAATDEFHQLFVEGRACQFTDWLIDTAGALAGLAAFAVILMIILKIGSSRTPTPTK